MANAIKGRFHLIPIQVTPTASQTDCQLNRLITNSRICLCLVGKITDDLMPVFRKRNADQGLTEIAPQLWYLFDVLCHLACLLCPSNYSIGRLPIPAVRLIAWSSPTERDLGERLLALARHQHAILPVRTAATLRQEHDGEH